MKHTKEYLDFLKAKRAEARRNELLLEKPKFTFGDVSERFGKKVRAERLKLNWSVQDLANRAGVTARSIYNVESSAQSISLDLVARVVAVLKFSLDEIIKEREL